MRYLRSSVSSVSVFGIQIRYLAHPFRTSGLDRDIVDHAAGVATVFAFMSPLPDVAGVLLEDARRASRMNFGVRMSLRFSM